MRGRQRKRDGDEERDGETEAESGRWGQRWRDRERGKTERRGKEKRGRGEKEALTHIEHALGTLLGRILVLRSQPSISSVGGFSYCSVFRVLI